MRQKINCYGGIFIHNEPALIIPVILPKYQSGVLSHQNKYGWRQSLNLARVVNACKKGVVNIAELENIAYKPYYCQGRATISTIIIRK